MIQFMVYIRIMSRGEIMRAPAKLYDEDFYAWTQEQAKFIKTGALDKLDIANLVEEVESMGASQKRELESRLIVILIHLLKWKYQPVMRSNSWLGSLVENRSELEILLAQNPSLTNTKVLQEKLTEAYRHAIKKTVVETGLTKSAFPELCEWTIKQVLDDDFLPKD